MNCLFSFWREGATQSHKFNAGSGVAACRSSYVFAPLDDKRTIFCANPNLLFRVASTTSRSTILNPTREHKQSVRLKILLLWSDQMALVRETDFFTSSLIHHIGKSNLMDAISFVLGIKANQLRGTQLKDLIYRVYEGSESKEAHVILYFQVIAEDGGEQHFVKTCPI